MKFILPVIYVLFSLSCIFCIYILNTKSPDDLFVLCFSALIALKHLFATYLVAKTKHLFVLPFISLYLATVFLLNYFIIQKDVLLMSIIIVPALILVLLYRIKV